MKKLASLFFLLGVTGSLLITGCGSGSNTTTNNSNSVNQQTSTKTENSNDTGKTQETATITNKQILAGIDTMLNVCTELKKDIQASDEAKVKATAPQLEKAWSQFEDGVKASQKDLYAKVEDPLDTITAGSQVSPLDKETLGKEVDQLTNVLSQLKTKF